MNEIANSPDTTANFALTEGQEASICAALPRSSNGKTTDSDSVAQRPETPPFRNLDSICSPRQIAKYAGNCEPKIYFIQAGADGPIKIGIAIDVRKRLNTLQVASHEKLLLLHSMRGDPLEEKHLHEKWSEHRIRGEWFRPDSEILDYLRRKGAGIPFAAVEVGRRDNWKAQFKAKMLARHPTGHPQGDK